MRRLFVPGERIAGGLARLTAPDLHYLRQVLRLPPGAELEVFDGQGGVFDARLGADEALVLGTRRAAPPPLARVHLAFALARGERCDLLVQKATELGVARLVPFEAARSVVRLGAARGAERARRWRRIAVEAARQSGRGDVPSVEEPAPLGAALASCPEGFRKLLFYEGGGEPVASAVDRSAPGHLAVIGPEGGLTTAEVETCLRSGARLVTLGPRVLRTETAGIVAAALLQHLLGDLGQDL
jgi:16S rRNA (uracil1498-N3)-methyltransferase